jgi:hypothetical protein
MAQRRRRAAARRPARPRRDPPAAEHGRPGPAAARRLPYADTGPLTFDEGGSYADRDAEVASTRTIEHAHSLGETVTAALGAGLRVAALREHLESDFDPRGDVLVREDDGLHRLRLAGTALPVLFTLVAAKP